MPAVPTPGLSQPPNTDQQGQQALVERQAIHLLLAAVQSRVAFSGSGGDASGRGGASCYVAAEAPEDPSCERWAVLARLAAFQEQQDSPGNTPACECAHAAVECILNPATPTESIAASPDVAGDIRPAGAASDPNLPTFDDELFH